MKHRLRNMIAGVALAGLALPALAGAAEPQGPPPPPRAANGNAVKPFATGVGIPTQIAFAGKNTFIAGAAEGPFKGGVFVVKPGKKKAVKVPGSPKSAFGIAAKGGKLYVSSGRNLIRFSGWNGKKFKGVKKVYTGPKKFTGFSGLAFGPNGRIYAGVALNQKFDHSKDASPLGNSVVSIKTDGRGLKVVSKGLRQPWMMTFAKGNRNPFVSVLAQDLPAGVGAPDLIVNAKPGQNYGFPSCNWLLASACEGFAVPVAELAPTSTPDKPDELVAQSPMGMAALGDQLYVALFNGDAATGPSVNRIGTDGQGSEPFLTGFVAPVLSVATHGGYVYAGDLTGTIYRVKG